MKVMDKKSDKNSDKKLDKKQIEDILALSPMQGGMLFHYLKAPQSQHYFEQLSIHLSGPVDTNVFAGAWNRVIERNEMLRTVFRWKKMEHPIQVILKQHRLEPKVIDLTDFSPEERDRHLDDVRGDDREKSFDLENVPFRVTLCRLEEHRWEMIVSNHHILFDGWSTGIILREFLDIYHTLARGNEPLKQSKTPYKEFIKLITSRAPAELETFWKHYLDGFQAPSILPVKKGGPGSEFSPGAWTVPLPSAVKEGLEDLAQREKLTMAAVLYGAWGMLLRRYTGNNDVAFGATVSWRSGEIKGVEDMVGLFINTLPLRVNTQPGAPALDLFKQVNLDLRDLEAHGSASLTDIKDYSPLKAASGLFDTLVVVENYPLDIAAGENEAPDCLSVTGYSIFEASHYDLALVVTLEEPMELRFSFNNAVYDHQVVERLSGHFAQLLQSIALQPGNPADVVPMLPLEEKERILHHFNGSLDEYEAETTIHGLFDQQAARTPDAVALVETPAHGKGYERQFTYKQLNQTANRAAAYLVSRGALPGGLTGLIAGRSAQMIIGILAILKSGCAYVPLNPAAPASRNRFMLEDCRARILLSCGENYGIASQIGEGLDVIRISDSLSAPVPQSALQTIPREHQPRSTAYVIYTSGSTGNPKGVAITHRNFSPLVHWGYRHLGIGSCDRALQNLSYYFDWSVWEMFIILTTGASLYMAPGSLLLEPGETIRYMDRHCLTVLHVTPTQYNYIAASSLNPLSLRYLFIGAEKLTYDLVKRSFQSVRPQCRVFNMYGPTEATIISAVLEIHRDSFESYRGLSSVPIGVPTGNTHLYILDQYLGLCPVLVPGELYIHGDGVAAGYINNPGLTSERFVLAPSSISSISSGQKAAIRYGRDSSRPNQQPGAFSPPTSYELRATSFFYKTGDLSRWLPDGNVEYLGRIDQQVKIRGFRIEPGEIENRILEHPAVREAAVIAKQHGSGEFSGEYYLCAYIVPAVPGDTGHLKTYLSGVLPGYMVPSAFVTLEKLPLNPNGKIDTRALSEPSSRESREYVAPRNDLEKELFSIWTEILQPTGGPIGIDDDYFQLGGHSLNATRLTAKIQKRLNVDVPLAIVFENPTIREMAAFIDSPESSPFDDIIAPVEKRESYPLSPAQERMFTMHRQDPRGLLYNITGVLRFGGDWNIETAREIFNGLIRRHESLRTSFHLENGAPVQRIHDRAEVDVQTLDLTETAPKNARQNVEQAVPGAISRFIRPFDLAQPPLFRVGVIYTAPDRGVLVFDMHHIISDGASMGVFTREFGQLARQESLPQTSVKYVDYVQWFEDRCRRGALQEAENYWLNQFPGDVPLLSLPADYPRPASRDTAGAHTRFTIGQKDTAGLKSLAAQAGTTLFNVLLSLYTLLLSKLSGQEDIVVGTPVIGREHHMLADVIGVFINTLPLRNFPSAEKTVTGFIRETGTMSVRAFKHQEYPFNQLVEKISSRVEAGHSPLFDVMFSLQDAANTTVQIPGVTLSPYHYDNRIAKFDFIFIAEEQAGKLHFTVEYRTRLFREETVERYVSYFKNIVSRVLPDPGQTIGSIEIISAEEKAEILEELNRDKELYINNKSIPQLFREQAARTPGHVALVDARDNDQPVNVTFSQLDAFSDAFAASLLQQGIAPGHNVGLLAERSLQMIVGMLSILKAGAAYVPLNPNAPAARNAFMLQDSNARVLLSSFSYQETEAAVGDRCEIVVIPADSSSLEPPASLPPVPATGAAYVIYTSGSTGNPKGVLVSHANLSPLLHWGYENLNLGSTDRALQNLAYYFDWSAWEIFITLTSGAALYMVPGPLLTDPRAVVDFIDAHALTILHVTPTQYRYIAGVDRVQESLRYLFIGAEKLTYDLAMRGLSSVSPHCRVFNMYGPTEATIISAVLEIYRDSADQYKSLGSVPIGFPAGNTALLILDKSMNPCPVNIPGELFIHGDGVAAGYINNPYLTAERFVKAPPSISTGNEAAIRYGRDSSRPRQQSGVQSILYKTGDLCRRLHDGSVEFLGRIDHQVKIRGYRIELAEIENRLLEHPDIEEAVVIDRENKSGEKYLCGYVVFKGEQKQDRQDPSFADIKTYLSGILPDYMVPAHFVALPGIPLNSNGKTGRACLPEPQITIERREPRNETERRLVRVWAEVLDIDENLISIDSDFFELGGHSLKVGRLNTRIHKEFNIEPSFTQVFETPTIMELGPVISGEVPHEYTSIPLVGDKEFYPLSPAQKRLFFLHQKEPQSIVYNIHGVMEIHGAHDVKRLENVFNRLIERHESLRTSFHLIDNQPVQRIHNHCSFKIDRLTVPPVETGDLKAETAVDVAINRYIAPFDIARPPLFRAGLLTYPGSGSSPSRVFLVLDMHHIISDGTSMAVFVREAADLYNGKEFSPMAVRYRDYTEWFNNRLASNEIETSAAFWQERFAGEIPVLNLPADYQRPAVQEFDGAHFRFRVDAGQTAVLNNLAREANTTLFGVLLSLFSVFLSRLSHQDDIVVGTPVIGRDHEELFPVMGLFINTLALRTHPEWEKRFLQFAREVGQHVADAFQHQDYPFEELVTDVVSSRDAARNPLFDAMFSMQDVNIREIRGGELHLTAYPFDDGIAKFDFIFICSPNEKHLDFNVEYSTRIFKKKTIRRFVSFFRQAVEAVCGDPWQRIGDIPVITDEEKQQILETFNFTEPPYTPDKTIPQLFREQAARTPDALALVGMGERHGEVQLTFKCLDRATDAFAAHLFSRGAEPGQMTGIIAERSVEMIVGIISILKTGCAYVPLNPKAPPARNAFMLHDCNTDLLVAAPNLQQAAEALEPGFRVETVPQTAPALETAPALPHVHAQDRAYVIYTSGSTGMPKGVAITHANFSPLIHWGYQHLGINTDDRALQNLAYYFDWSVWEIFIALTSGAALYMVPDELLLDPLRSASYIETHRLTVLHATPTQYQYMVKSSPKTPALRYLFIGAEKLTYDLVKRSFDAVSPQCRVFNMYGPTEATIISAVLEIHRDTFEAYRALSSVPIGQPAGNTWLYVLDPFMNLCPVNIPGELYIGGEGLAAGYINNPALTSERFVNSAIRYGRDSSRPHQQSGASSSPTSYPLYRTGDLCRWLPDGAIEFLGRIDHQVKIRGFRIELGEIENRLLDDQTVKEAVVIDRATPKGDKYLCAYIVYAPGVNNPDRDAQLKKNVSQVLPDYMVPTRFVALEDIPLNPNGKVDRKRLPEPAAEIVLESGLPSSETEKTLANIWSGVLGMEETGIGIDNDFFDLGGNSLTVVQVTGKIHKTMDVEIPLNRFFETPTIRDLAKFVSRSGEAPETGQFHHIERVEEKEYYPLSPAQARVFLLHQMEIDRTVYNVNQVMSVKGALDRGKFQEILQQLVARHESLRTSFHIIDGHPVQRIHEHARFQIEDVFYNGDIDGSVRSFIRPFDLSKAPLLRVGILRTGSASRFLILDMHHIISDGTSMGVFIQEFLTLYRGNELGEPPLRYRDFTHWFNRRKQEDDFRRDREFWLDQFQGEIPLLNLPVDFPRPAVQSFAGAHIDFTIEAAQTVPLYALARQTGTTLFSVLLSLFNILLSRLSGQQDIVVGTPVSGRKHDDLLNTVGMFVNTLALRNFPEGGKTVEEFIIETGKRSAQAFEHQEYPYEELVEKVAVTRDAGRNPLFDAMLSLLNVSLPSLRIPGLQLTPYPYDDHIAKFDFIFICEEKEDELAFTVEYGTQVFHPRSIARFISYFREIVAGVTQEPGQLIGDIQIISAAEKQELLHRFNQFEPPFTGNKSLVQLWSAQVERTPNRVALVETGGETRLTFKELDRLAREFAGELFLHGAGPGQIVGILAERSMRMITGILGILYTRAAYLPLNPKAPANRNRYMLDDCSAGILATTPRHRDTAAGTGDHIQHLIIPEKPGFSPAPQLPAPDSRDRAYVIYTSGSTGQPKGVTITHANLSPLLHWGYRHLRLGSDDSALQNLSYYFDWSVWEIFVTLTSGAALYMADEELLLNPAESVRYMNTHQLTVLHVTPTQYQYIVNSPIEPRYLQYLFIGAEKLTLDLVKRSFRAVPPDCRVFNMYGPTEATIISAVLEIHRGGLDQYRHCLSVPIGKPTGNTGLYILDAYHNLCPVNIPGELFIAGEGLAAGYINNPALTSERFVNPAIKYGRDSSRPNQQPGSFSFPTSYELRATSYFYKTGDLCRWLPDGTVEFLGRIDHQVKIRGFRIELGEIENRLLEHSSVKDAVVIDRESPSNEKYLCAYIVYSNKTGVGDNREELKEYLAGLLPDYMVPAHFVSLENIPLNPNGKVNRAELPEPLLETGQTGQGFTPARDTVDQKLISAWSDILEIDSHTIGIDHDFFQLGGHSLKAARLKSAVHKLFNVNLPLLDILTRPTVKELADMVRESVNERFEPIEPVEKRDYYPVSPAQRRLFVLNQMDKESLGYNIPVVLDIGGHMDPKRLEHAFQSLVARHESLRTSFHIVGGEPVQRVHDHVTFAVETREVEPAEFRVQATGKPDLDAVVQSRVIKTFFRPFDLAQAPLFRAGLISLPRSGSLTGVEPLENQYILVVNMHHIISDGVSTSVLVNEFIECYRYRGHGLPRLPIQYKDFALWHRRELGKAVLLEQEKYWLGQYRGEVPVLELPYDFPRPKVRSFEGARYNFEIDRPVVEALQRVTASQQATMFMALFRLFTIFLTKISGQPIVIVGTPALGRRHPDLESVIGMFVNTLAVKSEFTGNATVSQSLAQTKQNILDAFDNQDYQYEELVEKIAVNRDTGRNPLFDVMMVLQTRDEIPRLQVEDLTLTPAPFDMGIAKFDLMLIARETDDRLACTFEYCTRLFKRETVERFAGFFTRVVREAALRPDAPISQIDIISPREKHRLLVDLNRTGADYPTHLTVHRMFEEHARKNPEALAIRENDAARPGLTYGQLDRQANVLAQALRQLGIENDGVVAVMIEPGPEMMTGVMGILKAGGAYLPINPTLPPGRIEYLLNDSAASVLLTTTPDTGDVLFNGTVLDIKDASGGQGALSEETAPWNPAKTFDNNDREGASSVPNSGNCSENWTRSNGFDSQPTDLAYVIYTSGSTGRPKGVAVEHAQLVNFLYHMYNRYDKKIDANDRCLSLTNMMFDVSVWEYFLSLAFGAGIVVLPEEKRFDPAALAAALLDERITMAYIPPGLLTPVYEHLEKERGRVYLDKLLVGVEPIRGGVLENYMKLKPAMRIVNGYGPTETTICASSTNYRPGMPGNEIVPIGAPLDNNRIVLLDTSNNLSPWGIPGEICVSGAGVTRGYLNNPELTAEKYPQHPFYENTRMYRTGDLARLLPDGNLRFIGRRDHQLKIRGYRVELGEIEQRLLKHDAVQQALVIARTHDRTGKYLCAYVIAAAGQTVPESAELRKFLGRDLPDYMIPSYFVPIESIPLTPNGKVDTAALPEPAVGTGTAEFREARDAVERKLATIWAEVLDLNTPPGIDDDFFELGGHSLKATSLVHQVKKEFEVEIEIKDVFTGPTIREMAENVKNAEGAEFHAIPVQESREYYPLSYAQRRLWIICQFEDESTVYHLPNAFTVTGDFRVDAFEQAIAAVIQRHDSFRTVFPTIDGEPRQHILSHMPVDLGLEDIGEHAHENLDQYVRGQYIAFTKEPFNLETGPLMRFKVVTLPDRSRVVFLNIHHIITDGWSQGILLNELVYLYNAFAAENNDKKSPLPPLTLQYKDYSHWHNHLVGGGAFMEAEKYWLDKFKDKPNGIELPLDYPRKSRQTFEGYTLVFRIDAPTVQKLRELNAAQDSTLFMSLLALFNIFLYRYTGQSDIILGSPIAGRRHWELHEIIGFLVNTLVYRTSVEPGESFSQQLQRVKQETLDSYKYQDYPFDLLVDKLKPDRDLSQSPLFNVMLAHNNADVMDAALEMTGVEIENYGGRNDFNMSLFDLILFVVEDGDELEGSIMYNSDLFQRATIERMIENFLQLVRRVLEAPDKNISRLDILDEEQRRTVVETFNQSQYSFPEVTLQQMFEDQAERHPLRTAVVSREHRGPGENRVKHDAVHLTYDQLNREANQLANYLKQRFNITPNQVIGVSFDRSVRMVAVLLGIIKAGAGYLAVDPAYPRERVLHILADSDTDVLIIDKMRPELFSGYHGEILNVVDMWDEIAVSGPGNPPSINRPTDILYVNYTSGSTGTPNGAMLSHDCLTNLIKWQNTRTTIDCSLKCLQFTSINFCVSFQEIAGTLTAGGQLYLIGEIERQDIDYLMDFLARSRIEILFLPFSYLNFLFNESDRWNRLFQHNLKHIITAGEQLKVTAGFKKFLDANPVIQVHNHYGSTEMHVVTSYTLDASNAAQTPIPPAGKPISNIGIYILDEGMNPVPVGVWGELFVKGDTEILGYIRNQELTGAKLVHHSQLSQPGNIRLYRSGDIGRWMPDGNIELRGRKDFMVKIRGFRIELGEVESKILAIEKVKECVVVPREDGAGRKELFAYISVEGIEPLEIKRRIGDELPQYMIPQLIVMDALPLMPNGKVDRGQLPEPDFSAKDKREIVPPSNDIENTLVRIWAGLLDAEPETIGIDDNFFDLGGHSLKATTMMSKIHKELDVKIDLADIFKSQTIREIGDLIRTIKLAAETETAPQTAGTEEEIVEMIL